MKVILKIIRFIFVPIALGLMVNYIYDKIKIESKELTVNISKPNALIETHEGVVYKSLMNKLISTYKGKSIDSLYRVDFKIKNSGEISINEDNSINNISIELDMDSLKNRTNDFFSQSQSSNNCNYGSSIYDSLFVKSNPSGVNFKLDTLKKENKFTYTSITLGLFNPNDSVEFFLLIDCSDPVFKINARIPELKINSF
ncbi:hypothetical protein [Aliivibrio fischeri]|uniref:hypothetical protein n=1 Tax=Aliivibrio fischeri TaxID=668 RepID=UPI00084BFCCF|nr:hypothetical protein [Aliivibrio fischeri]OED51241.1 hypothetical protein BEI47_20130 [Aliivibrio fischeri]